MALNGSQSADCEKTSTITNGKRVIKVCWCKENCWLGKGTFGKVSKGSWKKGDDSSELNVAVKLVDPETSKYDYEIEALKKLIHTNIIILFDVMDYGPNK